MHLDAAYYISRVLIPPLERIFNLVGANVRAWYDEMPKTIKADRADQVTFSPKKTRKDAAPGQFRIDEHFQSSRCFVCGDVTPAGRNNYSFPGSLVHLVNSGICDSCRVNPQTTIPELLRRISKGENRLISTQRVCESCTRSAPSEPIKCESVDCAWLFERKKAERKAETIVVLQELVDSIEPGI
jgi:DNA polymerase zeta